MADWLHGGFYLSISCVCWVTLPRCGFSFSPVGDHVLERAEKCVHMACSCLEQAAQSSSARKKLTHS